MATTNVIFLLKRKPHLTFEDFKLQYENHMKLAIPVLLKYGVVYYGVQFNPPESKQQLENILKVDEGTLEGIAVGYDAITTVRYRDSDGFRKSWESDEQRNLLAPDGARFIGENRLSFWTESLGIVDGEARV